jgi:hypothetical protein
VKDVTGSYLQALLAKLGYQSICQSFLTSGKHDAAFPDLMAQWHDGTAQPITVARPWGNLTPLPLQQMV